MRRLRLASASPRRADLLRAVGFRFDVLDVGNGDDPEVNMTDSPERYAEASALAKLRRAMAYVDDDGIVISADTIVVTSNDEILGKPANHDDAARMLKRLSGRDHRVITGVAVGDANGRQSVFFEATSVRFRTIDDDEISSYVSTGEPMDKAGAYGIQERAGVFIESISGCYFNVVGLPVARLAAVLKSDFTFDITEYWRD